MIQEDKQLLLNDLCGRLSSGVICKTPKGDGHLCSIDQTIFYTKYGVNINPVKRDYFNDRGTEQVIKPYLRSMSSMTKEEEEQYIELTSSQYWVHTSSVDNYIDWLVTHHFDYRGLIEKGLALEAPEEMYK